MSKKAFVVTHYRLVESGGTCVHRVIRTYEVEAVSKRAAINAARLLGACPMADVEYMTSRRA